MDREVFYNIIRPHMRVTDEFVAEMEPVLDLLEGRKLEGPAAEALKRLEARHPFVAEALVEAGYYKSDGVVVGTTIGSGALAIAGAIISGYWWVVPIIGVAIVIFILYRKGQLERIKSWF